MGTERAIRSPPPGRSPPRYRSTQWAPTTTIAALTPRFSPRVPAFGMFDAGGPHHLASATQVVPSIPRRGQTRTCFNVCEALQVLG